MRANIPKNTVQHPTAELEGIYLQAMKEASVSLMEALPAGDDLWQMLGQIEAMLLEAQLREMPLSELFGNGGVAGFCQTIVDEYREDGEMAVPAAMDPSVKTRRKPKEPRGGVNYKKHRARTTAFAVIAVLLLTGLALWYTGVIRYWSKGDAFYLEELHNFQSTVTETDSAPITLNLPMETAGHCSELLYADGEGHSITLTSVEVQDYAGGYTDPDTGKTTYQKMKAWCLRLTYSVDAGFNRVCYVEPPSSGSVTVTLANGEILEGKITWLASGPVEDGMEYARISVIELPATLDTEGAIMTVTLDPPCRVEWNRVRTGFR